MADIVYPALHTLQSTVDVSHNVAPEPVPMVGVPFGQVQVLELHDVPLNPCSSWYFPFVQSVHLLGDVVVRYLPGLQEHISVPILALDPALRNICVLVAADSIQVLPQRV